VAGLTRAAETGCSSCPADKTKTQAQGEVQTETGAVVLTVASATGTDEAAKCAAKQECPMTGAKADCGDCPSKTKADGSACEACPAAKAGGNLPAMSYRVGEQDFTQYGEAVAAAAEAEASVHFVVAEQVYADKMAAVAALAEVTEARVEAVVAAHTAAADAVEAVFASYKVGDKSICCEKMAQAAADQDGLPVHYVIDGQETACDVTARLLMAQAKLRAAEQAVAATATEAEPSASVAQPATSL
jgi:hypothetical protein